VRRSKLSSDDGSSSLEFIVAGLILLVPLVYLILTMSAIQGGALAVEGASRQAARVFVQSDNESDAAAAAQRAIALALADYGLRSRDASVTITCDPDPDVCLTPRGFVTVRVSTTVPLPLLPPALTFDAPVGAPLDSVATEQVSRFAEAPE